MKHSKQFSGRKAHWLSSTLAAGALALAMVPGSALALATYDVSAFAELYVEYEGNIESFSVGTDKTPDSSVIGLAEALIDPDDVSGYFDGSSHNLGVTGATAADATEPYSYSYASLMTTSDLAVENYGEGAEDVSVVLFYSASLATTLTDLANEVVSAGVQIYLDAIDFLTGATTRLHTYEAYLDEEGQGGLPDGLFETSVSVPGLDEDEFPGALGLQLTVNILGSAESSYEEQPPTPGVPVPATLALLGIGLIGFAVRKRASVAAN